MSHLKGRVALVTGAVRGIGRAVALELAGGGAAVAVHYRTSKAKAEELRERIQAIGVPCMTVQGDVAVAEEAREVVRTVLEAWKRLDILVNNAGVTRDKTMRRTSDDEWADLTRVNLNGTFHCTSAAIPAMIEQKFGRIVNITSCVGYENNVAQSNYAASKGGLIAFTKALAIEMARHNITANCVAPGFTLTDMMAQVPPNIQEQIKSRIPLGRFGFAEEVAKAVCFLAADGDYITGQQLNVNGGIYM